MKIHGQRWRYRLANTEVFIDNVFSWFGWAQERMLVNGELAQSAGSWFSFSRNFNEPWLTLSGDGEAFGNAREPIGQAFAPVGGGEDFLGMVWPRGGPDRVPRGRRPHRVAPMAARSTRSPSRARSTASPVARWLPEIRALAEALSSAARA